MLIQFFLVTLFLAFVAGLIIEVPPNGQECFLQKMMIGERCSVEFAVRSGGRLDIDIDIEDPEGSIVFAGSRETDGRYSFVAVEEGDHSICFSNKFSTVTAKQVAFEISYSGGQGKGEGDRGPEGLADAAKKETVDQIEDAVFRLSQQLRAVAREHKYLQAREQTHRETNESTNSRVMWWSTLEAFMVVGMSAFQIFYLRRFFEVKRSA